MKHILLFGAGKSATVLIDYLKQIATEKNWQVTIADANLAATQAKVGEHALVKALEISIENITARKALIETADVVISLLPPDLHYFVALDCLTCGKNLLTASYIDDKIRLLENEIKEKGILFLYEMGLDPGIDHMSAMQLIDQLKMKGGKLISFQSHCGGLVAPESDDNPWHYKFSWNPRNVVNAGKSGALYKEKSKIKSQQYVTLFSNCSKVLVEEIGSLACYHNRDSLSYMATYGLEDAETFMRTTLRYPEFCKGWDLIIQLGLTDELDVQETDGISVSAFLRNRFKQKNISFESLPLKQKEQFIFLGWLDDTLINEGKISSADILLFILERKWALKPEDKDMIVMLHEIEYEVKNQKSRIKSSLVVIGEDSLRTAMAKTVGLPLGIGATLLLEGKINETGLHIPTAAFIYEPVLKKLGEFGILFREES